MKVKGTLRTAATAGLQTALKRRRWYLSAKAVGKRITKIVRFNRKNVCSLHTTGYRGGGDHATQPRAQRAEGKTTWCEGCFTKLEVRGQLLFCSVHIWTYNMWRMLHAYGACRARPLSRTAHWDKTGTRLCISRHLNSLSSSCLFLSIDLAGRASHTFSSLCQRSPCRSNSSSPVACRRSSRSSGTLPWALSGA